MWASEWKRLGVVQLPRNGARNTKAEPSSPRRSRFAMGENPFPRKIPPGTAAEFATTQ
jgi:hypothetical protein